MTPPSRGSQKRSSTPRRDSRLASLGLDKPDTEALTSYSPEGLRQATLADLLLRAVAHGDDHPVDGAVASVADEIDAVCGMVAELDKAMGTLLNHWAARLRVAAELVRRYREAPTEERARG
jgi:hypothetical protein